MGKLEFPFELVSAPEKFRAFSGLWKVVLLVRCMDWDMRTQHNQEREYHLVRVNANDACSGAILHAPSDMSVKGFVLGVEILRVQWVAPVTSE